MLPLIPPKQTDFAVRIEEEIRSCLPEADI
jgi:hypothetical protein